MKLYAVIIGEYECRTNGLVTSNLKEALDYAYESNDKSKCYFEKFESIEYWEDGDFIAVYPDVYKDSVSGDENVFKNSITNRFKEKEDEYMKNKIK